MLEDKLLKLYELVVKVSNAIALQGSETFLYLILYPQDPATASQLIVASVKPATERLFTGVVHGVKVVKLCKEDHNETELLSVEHAERICHS